MGTIKNRGLPGTVKYVRSGNLHMLEATPRRGWVHLTPQHRVVQAYKRGGQYHISLIMEWELDQAPDSARLREALAHVTSEFAQPKDAVLEMKDVQRNHVCVLNPDQLLFQGSI